MADDNFKLSTGLIVEANLGILGICPDGDLYGGYDQALTVEGRDLGIDTLTDAEKIEVAKEAISRWQAVIKEATKN